MHDLFILKDLGFTNLLLIVMGKWWILIRAIENIYAATTSKVWMVLSQKDQKVCNDKMSSL